MRFFACACLVAIALLPATLRAEEGVERLSKIISYHTRDAEIRDIVQSIADLCKVNVMIDPKVRGKMQFNINDVPASDAISMLARITGNSTTVIGNVLIVGQEETIKRMEGKAQTLRARLSYAKAEDIAALLTKLYPKDATAIHYAPTNTVIVSPK